KTAGIADVYVDYENSAAAQSVVKSAAPGAVEVALDRNPAAVFVAPPHAPREARVIPFSWRNGVLSVKAPEMAEWVLWVDPAVDPRQPLPELELAIRDSAGAQRVKLEMAVADNGDWIGFADLMPREAGRYALTSSVEGAELLLQDRWDPSLSRRGKTEIEGSVRDATEIFVRFPPGKLPELTLDLRESHTDRIVNFLRNGNFEEGIPNYPPRGWTLGRVSADPDLGWAGWTQEDAFEGKSAMKFVRPTGTFSANSHPMRLRTGGRYVFRFMARGDATHA